MGVAPGSGVAGATAIQAVGMDCGGKSRHLVSHSLDALHDCEQLLLLRFQDGVLLSQLVAKLGWVCWLHLVRTYC